MAAALGVSRFCRYVRRRDGTFTFGCRAASVSSQRWTRSGIAGGQRSGNRSNGNGWFGNRILLLQRPSDADLRWCNVPAGASTGYPASTEGVFGRNAWTTGWSDQPRDRSAERVCAVWRNKVVAAAKPRDGHGRRCGGHAAVPVLLCLGTPFRHLGAGSVVETGSEKRVP